MGGVRDGNQMQMPNVFEAHKAQHVSERDGLAAEKQPYSSFWICMPRRSRLEAAVRGFLRTAP
jgi:hypothetical protein